MKTENRKWVSGSVGQWARLLLLAFSLSHSLTLSLPAANPTPIWITADFTGVPLTNAAVTMTPIPFNSQSNITFLPIPRTNVTDSAGTFSFTNVYPMAYRMEIEAPDRTVTWTNCIPDVSGVVYIDTSYICPARSTNGPAYAAATVDRDFLRKTNSTGMSNTWIAPRIFITPGATNPPGVSNYALVVTNVATGETDLRAMASTGGNYQTGSFQLTNLLAMGITNIVTLNGTAEGIGTNAGVLYITNVVYASWPATAPGTNAIANIGGNGTNTTITNLVVRGPLYWGNSNELTYSVWTNQTRYEYVSNQLVMTFESTTRSYNFYSNGVHQSGFTNINGVRYESLAGALSKIITTNSENVFLPDGTHSYGVTNILKTLYYSANGKLSGTKSNDVWFGAVNFGDPSTTRKGVIVSDGSGSFHINSDPASRLVFGSGGKQDAIIVDYNFPELSIDPNGSVLLSLGNLSSQVFYWVRATNAAFNSLQVASNDVVQVLFRSGATVSASNATETTLFTNNIPGNAMGTNRAVLVDLKFDYINNTGGTSNFTVKVWFGSALVYSAGGVALTTSTSTGEGRMELSIANRDSASSQDVHLFLRGGVRASATVGTGSMTAAGISWMGEVGGTSATDTTASTPSPSLSPPSAGGDGTTFNLTRRHVVMTLE